MSTAVLAYLQLLRAPAAFTAASNVLAAQVIATGGSPPPATLALLVASSVCLYGAGMVLNDCFDLEEDRRERPRRPLPAGRVPVPVAWTLGFALLLAGLLLAAGVGGAALWVATGLAGLILLYDGYAKHGWSGPLVMGACRSANWLLGLSTLPLTLPVLALALPAGLYALAITVLARLETGGERGSVVLAGALLVVTLGALVALWLGGILPHGAGPLVAAAGLVWLGPPLLGAWRAPAPSRIQALVGALVLGFIALDAALLAGAGHWTWALAMGLLWLPARRLSRRLRVS